jgi:hypothetical protein
MHRIANYLRCDALHVDQPVAVRVFSPCRNGTGGCIPAVRTGMSGRFRYQRRALMTLCFLLTKKSIYFLRKFNAFIIMFYPCCFVNYKLVTISFNGVIFK